MRPLIAVEGCEKQRFMMERQQKTWAVNSPIDIEWFTGPILHVPDDYWHLSEKTRAICQWALVHGYTHTFICDDDVYVRPERLLTSGFEAHDYVGFMRDPSGTPETNGVWPSQYIENRCTYEDLNGRNRYDVSSFMAGMGYWLSTRSMELIAESPIFDDAEDRNCGKILHLAGVPFTHDARYQIAFPFLGKPGPCRGIYPWYDIISVCPMAWNDVIFICEFKGESTVDTPHKMFMRSKERLELLQELVTIGAVT